MLLTAVESFNGGARIALVIGILVFCILIYQIYNARLSKLKEEVKAYKLKDREIELLSQYFVSRDEKYIASLGNGYIMNYLANKSLKNGFVFFSDKRVYFKGSCLSGIGKKLIKMNEERTVDVKNITGSGFIYKSDWGNLFKIVGMVSGIGLALVGALFFEYIGQVILIAVGGEIIAIIGATLGYLLGRKTYFRIDYAGGCIAFDVSFYAKAEIDDFQKQLRRAKDLAEETATIKTVAVETPVQAATQNSVPDDLRKYADLLKEGLISQEEYDAMKKKILEL